MSAIERTQMLLHEFLRNVGPIRTFRPVSYEMSGMDMLRVCVVDTSEIERWHGLIHLETCHENHGPGEPLSGFHLVCYQGLQGKQRTRWVLTLLIRAFRHDMEQRGTLTHVRACECVRLYAQALGLLLRYPRTWRIRAF